jgi:hypothetical protein
MTDRIENPYSATVIKNGDIQLMRLDKKVWNKVVKGLLDCVLYRDLRVEW